DAPGMRRELFLRGTEPGGGQALPDRSVPQSEPSSNPDGDAARPAPTPRAADSNGRTTAEIGGIDPGLIPLPPDARKIRPRPGAEPTPVQKRTFGAKLKDLFGLGSPASANATPTPTPTPKPKPKREDTFQPDPRPTPRSTPRPAPRAETMIRPIAPIAFSGVRAGALTTPALTPRPKPPPRPQVATRPRTVTGRKQNEKGAVKTASGSQDAKPDKDKLDASASRSDEKKSAKKGEVKTPDKPLEIKRPELKQPQNNQNKKTSNQVAKTIKLAPTPKPSPKPSPKASPKPSPTVSPVTPAVANSVANSTPKGEG